MKRKDVQRLAAELVDGIEQMRRDLALRDAQVQQLTAEVERLRVALALAAGELISELLYLDTSPEELMRHFLREAEIERLHPGEANQ